MEPKCTVDGIEVYDDNSIELHKEAFIKTISRLNKLS